MKIKRFISSLILIFALPFFTMNGYCFISNIGGNTLIIGYDSNHQLTALCGVKDNQIKEGVLDIPETVNYGGRVHKIAEIAYQAFKECTSLTSLTIPSFVTVIESEAFMGCTSLTSLTILSSSSSFTRIYPKAFMGCSSLSTLTIPASVEIIDTRAFEGCSSLKSLTIPSTIQKIGPGAFRNTNLTAIYCHSYWPIEIDGTCFAGSYNATLYVPLGCKKLYEEVSNWHYFKEIIEMDFQEAGIDGVTGDKGYEISVQNSDIIIKDKPDNSTVGVYNMEGVVVYSGTDAIISGLRHGIYIVRINDQITKVIL